VTQPATLRQADVDRAVKVFVKNGVPITGARFCSDGSFTLFCGADSGEALGPKGWGDDDDAKDQA
jgi:hypothetical protein